MLTGAVPPDHCKLNFTPFSGLLGHLSSNAAALEMSVLRFRRTKAKNIANEDIKSDKESTDVNEGDEGRR